MKKLLALLGFICAVSAHAQDLSQYEKRIFISNGDTLRYRILYPENYKSSRTYPLVVFLHGSGERGRDNDAQLLHGGDLFLKPHIRKHFKAIVIFPQCPKDSAWSRFKRIPDSPDWSFITTGQAPTPQQMVKQLIDEMVTGGKVNTKKIYIGGLSLGGMGTYDLLIRYPGFFAAAFPICGAVNSTTFIEHASKMPLWIFHGALDNTVPPTFSRNLYTALIMRGSKNVLYTEYPKAGHNSWDSAFAEPGLMPWLFSVKKKKNSEHW
jgi:predicted peptidase